MLARIEPLADLSPVLNGKANEDQEPVLLSHS
jgi:hypothetical protein